MSCGTHCHGRVGVGCDSKGLEAVYFPCWKKLRCPQTRLAAVVLLVTLFKLGVAEVDVL